MGLSFYGKTDSGEMIALDYETDPAWLDLNLGNAAALLGLLGLPCERGYGECSVPEARRAVILARNTFMRRAPKFTRAPSDTRPPGRARCMSMGLDEEGLAARVDRFERFVEAVAKRGAVGVYWS